MVVDILIYTNNVPPFRLKLKLKLKNLLNPFLLYCLTFLSAPSQKSKMFPTVNEYCELFIKPMF